MVFESVEKGIIPAALEKGRVHRGGEKQESRAGPELLENSRKSSFTGGGESHVEKIPPV